MGGPGGARKWHGASTRQGAAGVLERWHPGLGKEGGREGWLSFSTCCRLGADASGKKQTEGIIFCSGTHTAVGSLRIQLAPPFWGYFQHQPGTYHLCARWSAVFKLPKTSQHQIKWQSYNNPPVAWFSSKEGKRPANEHQEHFWVVRLVLNMFPFVSGRLLSKNEVATSCSTPR